MLDYIVGSLDNIYFYIITISIVILFIVLCLFLIGSPTIFKKRESTYFIIFIVLLFIIVFVQNQVLHSLSSLKTPIEGLACGSQRSMLSDIIGNNQPGSGSGSGSGSGYGSGSGSGYGSSILGNVTVGAGSDTSTYMSTECAYKYIANYLDQIIKNTKPLQYKIDTNLINTK